MDASIPTRLAEYLNGKMGGPETVYAQAGLPVAWTVTMPRDQMPQDIQTVIRNPALGKGVLLGIIQPGGSSLERTIRGGPYDRSQPRAGAIRVGRIHLAVLSRSLKQYANEGKLLMIEDALQELLPTFSDNNPHVESFTLESAELGFMSPDIHVVQYDVEFKYVTRSLPDTEKALKEIQLTFTDVLDVLKKFGVEDVEP